MGEFFAFILMWVALFITFIVGLAALVGVSWCVMTLAAAIHAIGWAGYLAVLIGLFVIAFGFTFYTAATA